MRDSRLAQLRNYLKALGNDGIAQHSRSFFKTGKGEYGEGDVFLGIRVPELRKLVKAYPDLSLNDLSKLLLSEFHEEWLLSLLMLVARFQRSDQEVKKKIYHLYLNHTAGINSWDLVDSSAAQIVGAYLNARNKKPLYDLAGSQNLWERRIAIIASFHFIRNHEFEDTLRLSELLINDREDLIHKAVGWMLREIGKRHMESEAAFLTRHYRSMPRTMLRYAIERFPEATRQAYLKGTIPVAGK
jgi:3-methyladenine DNA glycosylase AlkD